MSGPLAWRLEVKNHQSTSTSLSPCRADCGKETRITPILVQVQSNFVGHPTISASVLMASATWNLCLDDATRRSRGEQDLCW